jgi:hypothetical protein
MMKKAFTVVEILIAMLLLFGSIVFVNISIKAFNNYQRKSEKYQNIYITVLSLKDWLSTQMLDKRTYEGTRNGYRYIFKIKPILQAKNYTFSMAFGAGNYGDYLVTLYEVELFLMVKDKEHTFNFILTNQKSIKINLENKNE